MWHRYVLLTLLLLLTLLTLPACTSWQVRADNRCISYGFMPGTLDYNYCMERAAAAEQAFWAGLAGLAIANHQANQAARRPAVACTSGVTGMGVVSTLCSQ
jgi:hypothetical protein